MTEEVVGFTKGQRTFFLEAFGYRCAFHQKRDGRWVRCEESEHLQVHHIVPRGWYRRNMGKGFPVNGAGNGIPLCRYHHEKVHPDVPVARRNYRQGNKSAFAEMVDRRKRLCAEGIPYWTTQWDMMFYRLNQKTVARYMRKGVSYPHNSRRGLNGRVKRKRKRK